MAKRLKYLRRQARILPLRGVTPASRIIRHIVVIPARGESGSLPDCLRSLAANPAGECRQTWCLVIVNNPPPGQAGAEYLDDNLATLRWLDGNHENWPFHLAFADAASPGRELPAGYGVGLARKLGADTALAALLETEAPQTAAADQRLLFHLDADTRVEANYFAAVRQAIGEQQAGAGVIAFRHAPHPEPAVQRAIALYELWMRCYVLGLRRAGSPYAFHTVGSTMVSTLDAYIRAGGMPARRSAGEDFYFLQQLAKSDKLIEIETTTVHPSPRPSNRVPFGTGPHIATALGLDREQPLFEPPAAFSLLATLLSTIAEEPLAEASEILERLTEKKAGTARRFLEAREFDKAWAGFRQRCPGHRENMLRAFHQWFDGLATRRLINQATPRRLRFAEAWPRWSAWLRLPDFANPADALACLRRQCVASRS